MVFNSPHEENADVADGEPGTSTRISTKKLIRHEHQKVKNRKMHYCKFCDNPVQNFCRHLQRHHFDENEVQEFLSLDKNSDRRKLLIAKIRKEGDFSEGEIPVYERPNTTNDRSPCVYCKGYYSKRTLRKHVKRCGFNKKNNRQRRY